MPSPLVCLVGFAMWGVLLVLCVGAARVAQVLAGKKRANEFPSGQQHGGDRYWRLNRAHINTMENLPVFAVLVIAGLWLRLHGRAFAVVPVVILVARVLQSLVHISSGSSTAVSARFAFFGIQLAGFICLAIEVLRAAM